MTDRSKQGHNLVKDVKALLSVLRARRTTMFFAYTFMFAFVACTLFLAFNPNRTSSPWFNRIFTDPDSYKSRFSSLLNRFFPDSQRSFLSPPLSSTFNSSDEAPAVNQTQKNPDFSSPKVLNQTDQSSDVSRSKEKNQKRPNSDFSASNGTPARNRTGTSSEISMSNRTLARNQTQSSGGSSSSRGNPSTNQTQQSSGIARSPNEKGVLNFTALSSERNGTAAGASVGYSGKGKNGTGRDFSTGRRWVELADSLKHCNIFDGKWVKDDSYPLYPEGSCPHIDEPFNCFLNGRPDRGYQKLRWKPNGCEIPRLNATDMLERLRGKRLVFVGDSLNRNMWEALVCALRHSVKDKSKVFEASGRREFRTEGSYSFIFKDYNCSVEFFRSPFLVQEWETPEPNGTKKETLRLDVIERSSSKYKNADVIVFNTGHWWTHEKTSKGKDYYQEGSHIYGNLNVVEAFRKALTTWARWVDANVNRNKTLVFFRGYSASHFSGGRWNSGGACDRETEPIKNETYLAPYPPKMNVLERVLRGTKTPINYLNITRLTDYRKDAHPSIYRKQNLSDEERRSPERYQDCSHWCLPGVPDIWNELLYAQLVIKLGRQ